MTKNYPTQIAVGSVVRLRDGAAATPAWLSARGRVVDICSATRTAVVRWHGGRPRGFLSLSDLTAVDAVSP